MRATPTCSERRHDMAGVTLKNVVKRFGNTQVVDDLSLRIEEKEFAVLVGSSGCGKTTALRMIAGLESVTSGDIYIGDTRVNDMPPKDRDIAMVFQSYALYPHLNIRDNISFGLKIRQMPKKEIDQRVEEAADVLGLGEMLERKPKELSGGQRQRVALGRAIVRKPRLFLFDEPLSNLDAKLRVAMRAEISKLHRRLGTTIIYVTHDQVEAMTMADRIFIMNKGVLQQSGTPMEVYSRPANRLVAGFIGSPAMNFLEAKLQPADGRLYVEAPGLRLALPERLAQPLQAHAGRDVVFGLRPEDISLARADAPFDPATGFEAQAEVVETLGSEIFAYLRCSAHSIVARMETPDTPLRVGDVLRLKVKMEKSHLFDPATALAIG
jgi:multiple sugar transport system ATP-binding protein